MSGRGGRGCEGVMRIGGACVSIHVMHRVVLFGLDRIA